MVSVVEGHVVSGLREIHAVRDSIASSGDVASFVNLDGFVARAYVFLATGELSVSKVKNPGLVLLLPVAAKRGRAALTNLLADIERHGFDSRRASVEFELGRLAKHQRRTKEARSHLEAVERLLVDEPYAYLRHQARTMLADL
jgi:hypothetical protein